MINSTLDYGPGCTVAAVHQLTGIPIDHFITVDFSGVVQMSDAVGGVPVCVSDNVYDPYSHLKLKKGGHTLKGMAALQFVRSRHGFGDGSDLGRTVSQHMFLGSMVRQLKSAGTLADPAALYSLANAATKALTVDTGLSGIPQLVGFATTSTRCPATGSPSPPCRTAGPDQQRPGGGGPGRAEPLQDDHQRPVADHRERRHVLRRRPGHRGGRRPGPPRPPQRGAEGGRRGAGRADRRPGQERQPDRRTRRTIRSALIAQGYSSRSTDSTGTTTARTTVGYTAGREADAQEVAASLGLPSSAVVPGAGSGITLTIGTDWTSGATFGGSAGGSGGTAGSAAPVDTQAALSNASAQTADDTSKCAQVGHQDTVAINGVGMSPIQAYSKSPDVPDSAP